MVCGSDAEWHTEGREIIMKGKAKRIGALGALLTVLISVMGVSPSANSAPWTMIEKVGCFELMSDGTFHRLTNVCPNGTDGQTALYTTVILGGVSGSWCIGQHQNLHLGLVSEYSWARNTSWPSGCQLASAPYRLN